MEFDRQPIKTFDERIEEAVLPKERLKSKKRQRTPLTTDGFTPYRKEKIQDKTGGERIRFSHAAGPIPNHTQMVHTSYMNPDVLYDEDVISNWVPHMSLSVFDEQAGRPLSAAEINTKMNQNRWIPHYFVNPMQDLDYITLEALTRFTFIGPLMDAFTKFTIGTGFKPELELLNPSNDIDNDQEEIAQNQDIIDTLLQIDTQVGYDESGQMDIPFVEKIAALISTANIFNRSALVFGYDRPVTVNGTVYKQIPSSIKFAHPRDLGIIDADPGTWRLNAVQWRNAYYMIPSTDMIYLWNPLISAKTRGSWLYGDSMIMPMIDASRVIRKNIGVNFLAMAEATWAGLFLIAVKPNGQTPSEKNAEYKQVVQNMVRGGPNVLMEDPNDIKFQNVDFNPKVAEFQALTEFLIKSCVASTGMPHSMFYDEATSNRATMIGKIQLAVATVINPQRAWIGRMISPQWYQRWFRLIYKDKKPEIYKQFKIKMTFSDLHIEEWFDKIQSVNQLDSRKQLTDAAYGELAGIENYQNKVEQDAQTHPGGSAGNKMTVAPGEGFEMSKPLQQNP